MPVLRWRRAPWYDGGMKMIAGAMLVWSATALLIAGVALGTSRAEEICTFFAVVEAIVGVLFLGWGAVEDSARYREPPAMDRRRGFPVVPAEPAKAADSD